MYSHTTPNLRLYKGLTTLLQVRERGKFTFYTKLKSCLFKIKAPHLLVMSLLCCCCCAALVQAYLPSRFLKENVMCLTIRLTHPMQTSPAGKSGGDLEAKHEHCTHSGGLEKKADEGPSLQTVPVNATSTGGGDLKKARRSRLAQLDGERRGVGAVGTGSGVTQESAGTAKLFSCNPETDSCGKNHFPSLPAKHSFS